jgi:serpin B
LQEPSRTPSLALANRLYGEVSFPFDTTYFTIVRKAFDVWIEPVDFAGDPEGTRNKINTWIAERTANRTA